MRSATRVSHPVLLYGRPRIAFVFICLLLLTPQHSSAALVSSFDRANSGIITKEVVDESDLICMGVVADICLERTGSSIEKIRQPDQKTVWDQDTLTIETKSFRGDWLVARFLIDGVVKGRYAGKNLQIKFFCQCGVPESKRSFDYLGLDYTSNRTHYIVCLRRENEQFVFTRPSHTLAYLPSTAVEIAGITDSSAKLVRVLQDAVARGDTRVSKAALRTLTLNLKQEDLLTVLKDLPISDGVLAERLRLDDQDAWQRLVELAHTETRVEIRFNSIEYVLTRNATPKRLPYYLALIESANPSLRAGGALAMSEIRDRTVVPYLVKMLDNSDPFVRYRGLYGLSVNVHPMTRDGAVIPFTVEDHKAVIELWRRWWATEGQVQFAGPVDK